MMKITKRESFFLLFTVSLFTFTNIASAHSTVSPSETLISKYETFILSVPTEKEVPTVAVKLLIPETLDRVTPFVKSGWKINVVKNVDGRVTEIDWLNGAIPTGQKDVFQFTARTAATGTTLIWKAYQTYQDGVIVAWDRDPSVLQEGETKVANPYSTTNVKSDLGVSLPLKAESPKKDFALPIAGSALVLSLFALSIARKK